MKKAQRKLPSRSQFVGNCQWTTSKFFTALLLLGFGLYLCLSASAARPTTNRPIIDLTNNTHYLDAPISDDDSSEDDIGSARTVIPASYTSTRHIAVKPNSIRDEGKKQSEPLSENCFAKRDSTLRKRSASGLARSFEDSKHSPGHQRLRPNMDASSIRHINVTISSEGNFDAGVEHVPECTDDGKFQPIQCLLAYCWCVNKYGQAFKNSARANEKPICDKTLYESESNDLLVVTGIGASRMKNPLKPSGSRHSSDANGLSNDSGFGDHDGRYHPSGLDDSEFSRRVGSSPEPSLALVPNECAMSRENALARKAKHSDLDGIWIPDCDSKTEKLYAERQCHKSKVCWCVDQVTGLPLRTSEQLTKRPDINCTEIRRIIEIASTKAKQESQKVKPSFFHGFSESCDAEKRSEFVHNLIGQFRQQLSDFLKQNPSESSPKSLLSADPYKLSEEQVALWRFVLLDLDEDGKLDDREWSKFKVNFKLVERLDIHPPKFVFSQQHDTTNHTMSPLYILRSQRKCWRDFLEFCGDGDILDYSSINRSKWLSCTELPAASAILSHVNDRFRSAGQNPGGVPDAYTRAAAEARRKSKNPFLGILKPD